MYGRGLPEQGTLRPWGREDRAALLAPAGTRWRFRLSPPPGAVLRLGVGYVPLPEPAGVLDFRIEVDDGRETARLLDRRLEVRSAGGWSDLELDLGRWGRREIDLLLITQSAPGSEALVWGAWSAPEIVVREPAEPGWSVLLVVLDTLRADRLGCYGYRRPTSPALDRLAERGVRFATAVTQSPWTRPAHRALFNGLYPISQAGLASPPLAEVLWRAGYRTRALTGGGQLNPRFGFQRGFEEYRIADWVRDVPAAGEWIGRGADRRQFLFLHTYEVHDPFDHAELAAGLPSGRLGPGFSQRDWHRLGKRLTAEERAYVAALYDGGVAFTDRALGELLAELEARRLLERTIVVVTSDHGEQLFEHGGFRHGQNVYDHQLLVPLIVWLPPELRRRLGRGALGEGAVVAQQVRLVDLYPTLLDLAGVRIEHAVQGRSLVPLLAGGRLPPLEALAEDTNVKTERRALRSPAFKLILSWPPDGSSPHRELFDLRRDPGERRNLIAEYPEVADRLERRLEALGATGGGSTGDEEVPTDIDPELRRELEALGYLGN